MVTYPVRFECSASQTLGLLSLSFFHHHVIVTGTCWNDHSSIRVSTMNTFVKHDVLGIVFSKTKKRDRELQNCLEKNALETDSLRCTAIQLHRNGSRKWQRIRAIIRLSDVQVHACGLLTRRWCHKDP